MNIQRVEKVGAVVSRLGRNLPGTRLFWPYVETASWRWGRLVAQAVTDNAGQADTTGAVLRTAFVVAMTALVVGLIIWRAVVNLGRDVGRDIEAAGNWGG